MKPPASLPPLVLCNQTFSLPYSLDVLPVLCPYLTTFIGSCSHIRYVPGGRKARRRRGPSSTSVTLASSAQCVAPSRDLRKCLLDGTALSLGGPRDQVRLRELVGLTLKTRPGLLSVLFPLRNAPLFAVRVFQRRTCCSTNCTLVSVDMSQCGPVTSGHSWL